MSEDYTPQRGRLSVMAVTGWHGFGMGTLLAATPYIGRGIAINSAFKPIHSAAVMPTILCIDDMGDYLDIRKQMLETKGYSVLTADNGASSLKLLSDNQVDAVILDYRMPGMGGLAAATAIREHHGKLPIVLLSGYPTEIPERLFQMVDAFVTKGQCSPQVLLDELRRVTGERPPTKDIADRAKDYPDKKAA